MKIYIYALASLALLAGCEQKETTVNPPAENKTENNTTVVKPDAPDTSTNTTIKESTTTTSSPSP